MRRPPWGWRALLWALLLTLEGCAFAHRVAKFSLAEEFVVHPEEIESNKVPLAHLTYLPGWDNAPPQTYNPAPVESHPHPLSELPTITSRSWIDVAPLVDDLELRIYIRDTNPPEQDFFEIKTFTGALDQLYPNELRFVPGPRHLSGPYRLSIGWMRNTYDDYRLRHGDLLLVELASESSQTAERYLFQYKAYGLKSRVGYQVLFSVPVPFVQQESQVDVGNLNLMASLSLGYRFPARSPPAKFVSERLAGVLMAGVGSTALGSVSEDVNTQVEQALDSLVVGGGVEVFDSLSMIALFNLSALGRDDPSQEAKVALAVGFDAVEFAIFTKSFEQRLFRSNQLQDPPPEPEEGGQGGRGE